MNCREAGEALRNSGPQDNLSAEIREHLASCPQCSRLSDECTRLDADLTALYQSGFAPGMFDETLAGLEERPRRRSGTGWLVAAAAAAVLIAGGGWLVFARNAKFEPYELTVAREKAARFENVEGSRVRVRAGSRIAVIAPRRLKLTEGAVLVSVEPGKGDFRIEVPGGIVSVLGTEFSVNVEEKTVRVAVRRGKVKLENSAGTLALPPGRAGMLKRDPGRMPQTAPAALPNVTVAGETLWRPWRWLDATECAERLEHLRSLLALEDYEARVRARRHLTEAGEDGLKAAIAWTEAGTPRLRLEAVLFLRSAPARLDAARAALEKVAGNKSEQPGISDQARIGLDELKAKAKKERPAQ